MSWAGKILRVNLTTGRRDKISDSPASGSNDGASCPTVALFEPLPDDPNLPVNPAQVVAAGIHSHTSLLRADGSLVPVDRQVARVPGEAEGGTVFMVTMLDRSGQEATERELLSVFERNGITRIAAIGLPLDPNQHQAMLEIPSDKTPGTIVQEMQAGYMLKDRLLRPAMVGVAKAG